VSELSRPTLLFALVCTVARVAVSTALELTSSEEGSSTR